MSLISLPRRRTLRHSFLSASSAIALLCASSISAAQQAQTTNNTNQSIPEGEFFAFNQDGKDVLYTGLISGSGALFVVGDGNLVLRAVQPFEGEVLLWGGKMKFGVNDALNRVQSIVLKSDSGGGWSLLDLNGHNLSTRRLVLDGGILKNGNFTGTEPSLISAFEGEIESITGNTFVRPELRVSVFYTEPKIVRLRGNNDFGSVSIDRGGLLHLVSGTTRVDSLTIFDQSEFRIGSPNTDATFIGKILNGGTVSLTNSAAQDWQTIISDGETAGSFVKDGEGELTLKVAQTYTGKTTIAAGNLKPDLDDALSPLGQMLVSKDGTLNLNSHKLTLTQLTLDGGKVVDGFFYGALISKGGTIRSLTTDADVRLEKSVTTFVGDNALRSLTLLADSTLRQ